MPPVDSLPSSADLAARCRADGEFALAARFWSGGLRLCIGESVLALRIADGIPSGGDPGDGPGTVTLSGSADLWSNLLAPVPPRFLNDVQSAFEHGLELAGDPIRYAQYYPAIMRAVELLRPSTGAKPGAREERQAGDFDAPVGRYVHLDLLGQDHRVYFEKAGRGIPMLLQHTAGCHGSQWRHLFEREEITDRFRLIAYDLPYHGKSLPPVGPRWWAEEYELTAGFLQAVPLGLAAALELERPVFMGCSVGGLLALDLARHHPASFRAVISLEGALHIDTDIRQLQTLWHPQVSNEFKARLMNGLMSPTSPEAYRKETSQVYASGWPPAFLGDLHYYLVDYDLRQEADRIDTAKIGVHILSGEYDSSGTIELGREAHAAIPGSTWTAMEGVGHFPMSENPERFIDYLLPVLEKIESDAQGGD